MMASLLAPQGETVSGPTCGSGVLLVAAAQTMTNKELDRAVFYGQDLDFTCVKMCALNMLFFNLHSYVIWGNTLANETLKVFRTQRSYLGGSIEELKVDELPKEEAEKIQKGLQLSFVSFR